MMSIDAASVVKADREKMSKGTFEHGYNVTLCDDGSVIDLSLDQTFATFDQWVVAMLASDDE